MLAVLFWAPVAGGAVAELAEAMMQMAFIGKKINAEWSEMEEYLEATNANAADQETNC